MAELEALSFENGDTIAPNCLVAALLHWVVGDHVQNRVGEASRYVLRILLELIRHLQSYRAVRKTLRDVQHLQFEL